MVKKKEKHGAMPVGAAEFKAHCLELLDKVREHGVEYVVTKHGKPVARVVPVSVPRATLRGAFGDRMRITGEIVDVDWSGDWDAAR